MMEILWVNVLRIVHIFAGVLWVGAAFLFLFFISPSVKATGPEGQKFLQYFIVRKKYPKFMGIVATLTVLAGAILLWRDAGGDLIGWLQTGPGLGFAIGSVAALVVIPLGLFFLSPRAERLGKLGAQMESAGDPPSQDQLAELEKLNKELHTLEWIDFILLMISLLTMATARYWYF
jgi:uncharacterized membrane protein